MHINMKHITTLLLVIFLSGMLVPAAGASPGGQVVEQALAGPEQAVSLASSTAAGVAFEVRVPWETLVVEPVTAGGKEYVRVSLPGWRAMAEAGAPALPVVSHTVGVPLGASVTVRVVPGKAHIQSVPASVLPASTQKVEWGLPGPDGDLTMPEPFVVFEEAPEIYSGDALYPQALAEVTNDGILRQQRVIGVAAYPVQYYPATGEITVYESLRVEVAFEGVEGLLAAGAVQAESPVYEHLLQTSLLNYDAARSWRSDLLPAPAGKDAEGGDLGVAAGPWAPPNHGWRVKVRADGLYRLTYTQLQNAGFPVTTLDPRTFRMCYLGSEIAIYVAGEADGQFNPDDYILFYGQALTSKYTLDNVYWLTYDHGNGLRMTSKDGTPDAGTTPAFYAAQRRFEQGKHYLPGAPGDENLERWMWDYLYPPSRPTWSHTFSLAAPYAGTASLTVAMMGGIQVAANPDHHAKVNVNGTEVGDFEWDGITWAIEEMSIPPGVLAPMTNTLQVVAPNDTGVGYDVIYIDWAELVFPSTFTAEGNVLPFSYSEAGTWKYEIVGFTSNDVAVFDVTNPALVKRIEGVAVTSSGGGYAASFKDTVTSTSSYWAVASAAYKTVQGIEADTASNLQGTSNGADHIIITHPNFAAQAAQLSTFRGAQGMRAVVVSVQDVYDEFGHGIVDVKAIHDFLAYTYEYWQKPAPQYVILFGDGHYDPKNYGNHGRVSYIPPYLAPVDPWLGETAADNRYATLVGADTLPDMLLGRISVNTSAEGSAFVNKIISYEQTPAPGEWQQQFLAVADNADSAGNFAVMSDNLIADCLPMAMQAQKVYYLVTHMSVADARAAILSAINSGKLIVNYIGHGTASQWASEGLFKGSDVAGLTNGDKMPIMLPMTCSDGYYINPVSPQATSELITRVDGKGAVASWAPTGYGVASGHDQMNRGFLDAVFKDIVHTVGKAAAAGKQRLWATGSNLDLLDTYVLFGDPASNIILAPTSVKLLDFTASSASGAVTLRWETATEIDGLGFNIYRADSVGGPKMQINDTMIPTAVPPGSVFGAVYSYTDSNVVPGTTYYYWLEAVSLSGYSDVTGPVEARVPAASEMHIGSITMNYTTTGGRPGVAGEKVLARYFVTASMQVLDAFGAPVGAARASVRWAVPGLGIREQRGVSKKNGEVSFMINGAQPGAYEVCVTGAAKSGWTYDPAQNVETCKVLIVP